MKFTEDQFTPTKFSTAKEKAKFANQFVKFVDGGYKKSDFPKWFYRRLSLTFGHTAHYDIHGFYATFFTIKERKERFIKLSLQHPCYGQPEYTYCDVEKALQTWLRSITWQQLAMFPC